MNPKKIERGVTLILEGLIGKEWSSDPSYEETPKRVARFYQEMFRPRNYEVKTFPDEYKHMLIMRHHKAVTLCPHHLLPVYLDISVAYIPDGAVLGVSKLARLVMNHFTEPILQEALTDSIADELMKRLTLKPGKPPLGAAVLIVGQHDCMHIRGVESDADIVTSAMRGAFLEKPEVRDEFLALAGAPRVR